MIFINIKFFASTDMIHASDFENKTKTCMVNLSFISELSFLQELRLPMSGKLIGAYAVLIMNNNNRYCIKEDDYNQLKEGLNKILNQ